MIGLRIREYRQERKIKVADFAALIGISQGSLSDIENGKTKPSAETLSSIVRNTDIDSRWLLTGQTKMVAENHGDYQKAPPISARTAALVANFEVLKEEDKQAIERLAFTVAECQKVTKKAS